MYENVATLTCNKCGKQVKFTPKGAGDPFLSFQVLEEYGIEDWLRVSADVHLCPNCHAAYDEKVSECESVLANAIGARTVRVTVTAER